MSLTPEEIAKVRADAGAPPIEQVSGASPKSLSERLGISNATNNKPVVFPDQNKSFTKLPKIGMGETSAVADEGTISTVDAVKNTAKSLVTGTIESGKDIAAALGAPQIQSKLDTLAESDRQYLGTVIQLRNKAAQNKDAKLVEYYQNLVKNYKMTDGGTVADVFPEVNKSTEQILGDFASMALETVSAGNLAEGGAKKAANLAEAGGKSLSERFAHGAINGGKYGALFGITGAMQNNEDAKGVAKSAIVGAGAGALFGSATEGAFGKRITEGASAEEAKTVNSLVGKIIQGEEKDIPAATKALSSVDTKGVKTYRDLFTKLNDRVETLSVAQDTHLITTNKEAIPMDKLVVTTKVGDQEVTHNFITDALTQLKNFYEKTNDVKGSAEISQLEKKVTSDGLSLKDVNDIARLHGTELSGYNANGELASGLTKQAAENTRAGLKATVRQLAGDTGGKASEAIDKSISDTIRTRDLVGEVQTKINDLKQKIQPRTLGEKAGRLFSQVINVLGFNTPKGAIEYFLGRGTGLKTLNALDLEKGLQAGLKSINDLIGADSEKTFIKKAQELLKGAGKKLNEKINMKDIPNKEGGFIKIGGKKYSQIPDSTKKEMVNVIDYLRMGAENSSPKMEDAVSRLTQKYNINQDWSNAKIANAFENLIDKTKTL